MRRLAVNRLSDVGQRVFVVLLDQTLCLLVEMFDRVIAPPLVEVSVLVKKSTFVVKSVWNEEIEFNDE